MGKETTLLNQMDLLVEQGIYPNRDALIEEAMRTLLRSRPELRNLLAIRLYQKGEVSLSRGAEMCGLDIESFKEVLREAGVVRRIAPIGKEVEKELQELLTLRSRGHHDMDDTNNH